MCIFYVNGMIAIKDTSAYYIVTDSYGSLKGCEQGLLSYIVNMAFLPVKLVSKDY